MAWLPDWIWRLAIVLLVAFVVLRLGWAALRRFLGQDPAVWAVRQLQLPGQLQLRSKHPRRDAEIVRWLAITAAVLIVWLIVWGIGSAIAALGPHEGDAAVTPFSINDHEFDKPPADMRVPAGVNVYFTPTQAFTGCAKSVLLWPDADISDADMKENFRILVSELDALAPRECGFHYPVGQLVKTTVFPQLPSFLSDNRIADIESGRRNLYVIVAWRFYLDDNPSAVFITRDCVILSNRIGPPKICTGNFNGTRRHIVE